MCSDEDCTQQIQQLENVTADRTVFGKWELEEYEIGSNEFPEEIRGFKAILPIIEWDVVGNEVMSFVYDPYSEQDLS